MFVHLLLQRFEKVLGRIGRPAAEDDALGERTRVPRLPAASPNCGSSAPARQCRAGLGASLHESRP